MTKNEQMEMIDNLNAPVTASDIEIVYSDRRVALLHPFNGHIFKYIADTINGAETLLDYRKIITEESGKEKVILLDRLLKLVFDADQEYKDDAEQFLSQVLPLIEIVRSSSIVGKNEHEK